MLKTEGLSVKRGKNVILNDVNIHIKKGEIVGLVGPNGAGKSTFIKVCTGVINKEKGIISCNGINQDDNLEKYLENVQVCFDKAPFYPQLTGYQNLMQVARLYDVTKEDVIDVIKMVGLEGRMNDKVSKYSFGMMQRLNMAQMIMTKRELIILDEPLNGIDPEGVVLFRNLFKMMNEKYGSTLIISSHLLGELKSVCDRIIFMKSGNVVDDIDIDKDGNNSYVIEVDSSDEAIELLSQTYIVSKISDKKILLENESIEFNDFMADVLKLGIKIRGVESYNDVEKIYINKVGGELDE